uniref:Myb/SANT-like domain-containing protein n=1 Tax=Hordeum vulgare subsp. vulgare TaxID=112509 RepID=A0A8I6XMQ6_HORVV
MIKEIRKQSGVSWDDQQCKILVDPPLWKNIIIVRMSLLFPKRCIALLHALISLFLSTMYSHPKAGKLRTKDFPLFDVLPELHDGQTAEGTYNFTSIESSQYSTQAQLENLGELVSIFVRIMEKHPTMVRILEEKRHQW